MKNRIYLFALFMLVWASLFAQTDTVVELSTFRLKKHYNQLFSGDRKNYIYDSLFQHVFGLTDLNFSLGSVFPVYIKNYGYGMSTGISLRGSGSNHTALNWNGISLNSPTLGSAIFNSGISFLSDQINVIPGSGSATSGSGAIGGSVELTDLISGSPIKSQSANVTGGIGNYNTYQCAGSFRQQVSSKAHQFKFIYQSAQNQFPYTFNGEQKINTGADFSMLHLKYQGVKNLKNKSQLSFAAWFEQNHKGLQQGMGTVWNGQRMNDRYLRTLLHYSKTLSKKMTFHARSALLMDEMRYQSLVDANQNKVWRALLESYIQSGENSRWLYKIGAVSQQFYLSPSPVYISSKQENRTDIYAFTKYRFHQNLNSYLNIRNVFVNAQWQPLCFDGGLNFAKKWRKILYSTSIRSASNYRLPTLNERYWWPGGNPNLKPEISKQFEINVEAHYPLKKGSLSFFYNVYHNRINNWIQWTPGSATLWSPVNLTQVWITGNEFLCEAQYRAAGAIWKGSAFLNYNYSTIHRNAGVHEGKQLIYTPFNLAGGNLSVSNSKFSVICIYQYNGFRYTSTDNLYWLPEFHLCHLAVSKVFRVKSYCCTTTIQVNNLFNTRYQTMENFAMPGRNIFLRLQINYNK